MFEVGWTVSDNGFYVNLRGRKPARGKSLENPCIPQLKATRKEGAFHNLAGCVDIYTQFIARADN